MTVRVLLVDDDALVRAGLRIILSSAEDIEVVGRPTTETARSPPSASTDPTSC